MKKSDDLGIMANSNLHTLRGPARFSHIILVAVAAFIIIGIIWAHFAILDEVTSGEGKVIPSSQIQVVQNLEGGILREVLVREGQIVKANEVLMKIDDTRFSADFKEAFNKIAASEIEVARLDAEVSNEAYQISEELQKSHPHLIKAEKALLASRRAEIEQLQLGYQLAQKELNLTRPLVKKGAVSEVEVIRLERMVNELKGKLIAFKSRTLDELNDKRSELASFKEGFIQEQDKLTRTTVRSPVKGIIKQIKINTLGGVIQPGMDLIEIVPLDDSLLIEAKIRPSDIGFIRPDQSADVKITAYDFSIYGSLKGTVERISADTILDEEAKESFYLIRVRTDKNFLGGDKKPLYIIPGMQASVDILTGKKSVLDYILKPILKAKSKALRER